MSKKITSIELLRVISMLLIVAYHWQIHANNDSIYRSALTGNQIFSFILGSWGTLGVDLFFMISAYFLIHSNQVKITKLISMIIKVTIYGTAVVMLAYGFQIVPFDLITLLKAVLGIFAYQYWFLTVYLVVYIIHPALNYMIDRSSFKYLALMLTALVTSTYFIAFAFGNEFLGRLACGITIYLTVGMLEKYHHLNIFEKYRIAGTCITFMGCIVLEIGISYMGNNYHALFFSCIRRMQDTHSPVMLIAALFIFYLFKNMKIKQNKVIQILGKYSVGAYLIHGGASFIKDYLWDGLLKAGEYYQLSLIRYGVRYIACVLLIFIWGGVSEYIYCNLIDKNIMKVLNRLGINKAISFNENIEKN